MDSATQLKLAEVQSLRAEINSGIDRMNGNENFTAGTASAVFAFILANTISMLSFVLCLLTVIVVGIGWRRYHELRVHVRKLDNYLKALEIELDDKGGWTNHYYNTIQSAGGYSTTRLVFWGALASVAILGSIYVAAILTGALATSGA